MSSEKQNININISIELIPTKQPPKTMISLTINRTLVYQYSCGHTKRIKCPIEKICTITKRIRIDFISNIKEIIETTFQCLMVEELRSLSNRKTTQRGTNQESLHQDNQSIQTSTSNTIDQKE